MKRGQLSVFVIIGLLLVFTVGVIIYLNAQHARSNTVPQVEQVAEFAQPVQDYVHGCMERVAREGLQLIGDHGGYLSVRDIKNAKLNPSEPTDSDALFLAPDSDYGIPYWWYLSSKNACSGDCAFSSRQPALTGSPSIESQLESYVTDHVDDCLKKFDALAEQGLTVTEDSSRDVNVIITERDVAVSMEQDITASSSAGKTRLTTFVVELPVHLKNIYELANNITILEKENAFLGKHSRELISEFSQLDSSKLPPVGAVDIDLGPGVLWVKHNVEQNLIELLQEYVPLLQVFGTRNYRPLDAPHVSTNRDTIENALNRNAVIPNLQLFPELEARFTYLDAWKPYFDLNCRGELCRADSFMNTFGFVFGLQRYNFAYDLSYPVLVEIREPDAFNGRGYAFRFALEGNLRNNEPLTTDWEEADIPVVPSQESLLCSDEQRTSGVVNLTLRDTLTHQLVDGSVTFQCGTEKCTLGQTTDGKLSTRLPRCLGGSLSAVNPAYLADVAPMNTNTEDDATLELALNPIISVNVSVVKMRLKKDSATQRWDLDDTPAQFSSYDQALITLVRDGQPDQDQFSTFASVCGSPLRSKDPLSRDVRLTAGNYSVLIATLYHGNITIPVDHRCFKVKKFFGDDKKCFNVPEEAISFGNDATTNCASDKPFPSSNIQFRWEVTPDMLRAKRVQFVTVAMAAELLAHTTAIPGTYLVVEDLDQISATQTYVDADHALVRPEVTP
ncbi:MAG TPA: hypothetical protein VLJ21_03760 [Candidatus Binatia bacterium]|nr:hypothetical protein [Candidatus Binatia bacterium]